MVALRNYAAGKVNEVDRIIPTLLMIHRVIQVCHVRTLRKHRLSDSARFASPKLSAENCNRGNFRLSKKTSAYSMAKRYSVDRLAWSFKM